MLENDGHNTDFISLCILRIHEAMQVKYYYICYAVNAGLQKKTYISAEGSCTV